MSLLKSLLVPIAGAAASYLISSSHQKKAIKAQAQATNTAIATQNQQLARIDQQTAPQRAVHNRALTSLEDLITGRTNVKDTPGYQFGLGEGLQALERMHSAGGRLASGRSLKEGVRYAEDYAARTRGNEISHLARLAGLGAPGVNTQINAIGNNGSALSNLIQRQGGNEAQFHSNQGNVLNGTLANAYHAFRTSDLLGVL